MGIIVVVLWIGTAIYLRIKEGFINFAVSIRDDDCKQETPALSSV